MYKTLPDNLESKHALRKGWGAVVCESPEALQMYLALGNASVAKQEQLASPQDSKCAKATEGVPFEIVKDEREPGFRLRRRGEQRTLYALISEWVLFPTASERAEFEKKLTVCREKAAPRR